ncbi:MAG: esterase-like activity of phytase family protein [Acetobacteraceae bacterium]|nr:esterase-like activity of phytase family protein [Acetobacteraceae bacterium]
MRAPRGRRVFLAGLAALPGCAAASDRLAEAVALHAPSRPFLRPIGALEWNLAALDLGGVSGLHLAPDLTLTAITDQGRWIEARLTLDPLGLRDLRHGRLRDGAGQPLPRGRNADAEALARLPDGSWLIAYERWHRIRRHPRLDGPGLGFDAPPGIEAAPSNGGLEALAALPDGRLLAIAEALPDEAPGTVSAWLGAPRGGRIAWDRRAYRPAAGFSPTDATALGTGALVIERRFSWLGGFEGRLVLVRDLAAPVLEGEAWLDLPPDGPAENWEAASVTRHAGRTLLLLATDDNRSSFQRSLLLLYEVTPAGLARAGG